MKQLGNLALVCAQKDIVMVQVNGKVFVRREKGIEVETLSADWDDDEKIMRIIRLLNFGEGVVA